VTEVIRNREIEILEFDRIRQELASLTVSPMGLSKALGLEPLAELSLAKRKQQETGESRLLCGRSAFSPPAVEDISPFLSRASKGALLYGPDLAFGLPAGGHSFLGRASSLSCTRFWPNKLP